MLLGVSLATGFVGFCLLIGGLEKWPVGRMLMGHWGAAPNSNLAPGSPGNLLPGQIPGAGGGNPNQVPYPGNSPSTPE